MKNYILATFLVVHARRQMNEQSTNSQTRRPRFRERVRHSILLRYALLSIAGLGIILAADLTLSAHAQTCSSASITEFRNNVNWDLGEYGLIFEDADSGDYARWNCAALALRRKIIDTQLEGPHFDQTLGTNVLPFQGWLDGFSTSLVMATAVLLKDRDRLVDMDGYIRWVRDRYAFNKDPNCGIINSRWRSPNTCMEEYGGAAGAYAWIAAYEARMGRPASTYVTLANNNINEALSPNTSICIHYKAQNFWPLNDFFGPCSANVAALANGTAETISLNHGYEFATLTPGAPPGHQLLYRAQVIPYGLGLITGIASAYAGLQEAQGLSRSGFPRMFTQDQLVIMRKLFEEGQRHSQSNGVSFLNDCYIFNPERTGFLNAGVCGDSNFSPPYNPRMFPVRKFYDTFIMGVVDISPTSYKFTDFDEAAFTNNPSGFYHAGRRVVYKTLTRDWYFSRALPRGYLDSISPQGLAFGWACDPDEPTRSINVDFYFENGQYISSTVANVPNEPAVTTACRGGTNHRFSVQLPSNTKGQKILVYATDTYYQNRRGQIVGWQCADVPGCRW